MKELKIGDEVKIRKDLKVGKTYGGVMVVPQMLKYCGKRATIYKALSNRVLLNGFNYFWSPKMFEPISKLKEKLIFRDDVTILIKDGKKYVTKCDKNDTYDREKGLLVVLAKANGYKYNDIQEMLKNAETQNKKVREVKRVAKVGEYIKVVNAKENSNMHGDGFAYKNGDILRVIDISLLTKNGLLTKTCTLKNKGSNYVLTKNYNILLPKEYVVLENYKPKNKNNNKR